MWNVWPVFLRWVHQLGAYQRVTENGTKGNWRLLGSFNKIEMMIEVCDAKTTKPFNWYKIDSSHTYHLMGRSSELDFFFNLLRTMLRDLEWILCTNSSHNVSICIGYYCLSTWATCCSFSSFMRSFGFYSKSFIWIFDLNFLNWNVATFEALRLLLLPCPCTLLQWPTLYHWCSNESLYTRSRVGE